MIYLQLTLLIVPSISLIRAFLSSNQFLRLGKKEIEINQSEESEGFMDEFMIEEKVNTYTTVE